MKTEELRIGNYIYNPIQGVKFKVDLATLSNIIHDELKGIEAKYRYQPIPITEEILLKCGFGKTETKVFEVNECYIDLDLEYIYIHTGKHPKSIEYKIKRPKHLHHLQNLYFALTNEELNVKL